MDFRIILGKLMVVEGILCGTQKYKRAYKTNTFKLKYDGD